MDDYVIILCTTPGKEPAKKIAESLVNKKLAACVSMIEGVTSVYEWEGKICEDTECQMIIKSRNGVFQKIKEEITSMHPFEVPEIVSLNVNDGLDSYLKWISENT